MVSFQSRFKKNDQSEDFCKWEYDELYRMTQSALDNGSHHPLDEVIWQALNSVQEPLAQGDELARRYPSQIAPFAATIDLNPLSFRALSNLLESNEDRIALFTPTQIQPPPPLSVFRREEVEQMILTDAGVYNQSSSVSVEILNQRDVPDMLALTSATQPGPFGPRTIELGTYLGVRQGGVLVAMAGERMRLDGFTEISAVCVDPAYRGRGLATELIRTLVESILRRSETPFLHVFSSNRKAIALYRKLGFTLRRQMNLAVLGLEGTLTKGAPSIKVSHS